MHKPARPFPRFARFIRWAQAMLMWLAVIMCSDKTRIDRRHIRRRYRFASLGWAERLVRALVLIRTAEIIGQRERPRPPLRDATPAGFRRRIRRPGMLRAVAGARFRKAIKARDPRERIRRLLAALADIDAFARRIFFARALKRLTKLHALVMRAPRAEAMASLCTLPTRAADTS